MTNKQIKEIKDEYLRIKNLLQEEKILTEKLKMEHETDKDFKKIAIRRDIIEDEIYMIHNEEDIYTYLKDSPLFNDLKSDLKKKVYFFFGYVKEDGHYPVIERWNEMFLVFVPRNTKFDSSFVYYAMYWDLISLKDYVLVPIQDIKKFEKENYVIDTGEDLNLPYTSEEEYDELRELSELDNIEISYEEYRRELFKYFVQSQTEEEAIRKLLDNHKIK